MRRLKSIQVLTILTLFSSALFSIITPMSEEISAALEFNENQVAFINSMFLIVGALSSLIWAILGDKFSRKNLLIVSTIEWSIFTLFTVFSIDFLSLLVYQMITAIGFGAILPLIFSLTIDLAEPQKRGKQFGSLSAVYVLGNGLGQILSGFLIDYYSWQIPILIISISGFVCTGFLINVEEPRRGAKDEIFRINNEKAIGLEYKIKFTDFKHIWKNKSTIWILILNFAMFISIGAISSFFISMLKNDYEISSTLATVFLILVFGSQVPSGPIIGRIGDKKFENDKNGRIKVVFLCLLMGAICYIIAFSLFFISNIFTFVILFLLFSIVGAFLFGGIDPLTQATLGEINPPQIRSTIYSINYLTYTLGRSISLLILSQFFLIFNNFYSPGYFILAIMTLTCTLILVPILKNLPKDIDIIKSGKEIY
ncbi:MAG: MFS transporter [Candidatus Hermodarchaeota archaeon]